VSSRSGNSPETEKYIEELKTKHGQVESISIGSSLKLCMVAEGKADVYPRFGSTMEWDTAAAHAIVNSCGGSVKNCGTGKPLAYNKESLVNPFFVAERGEVPVLNGEIPEIQCDPE
jgi:3'(2'), 5'-bisphosphate nucleotidase